MDSTKLDRQLTIERAVADAAPDGAGSGTWQVVAEGVWAQVQDVLPSRGDEAITNGINVASRPARVRMRYREDVTADMRFVMGSRVMEITAGPAELGRRDGLEFMVKAYTSAGNAA